VAGSSQDVYRLSSAKREEGPEGIFWTLTFAPIPPASGPETAEGDIIVMVTDAVYQELLSQSETMAGRKQIEGMHSP
jgi:hypothetical protein